MVRRIATVLLMALVVVVGGCGVPSRTGQASPAANQSGSPSAAETVTLSSASFDVTFPRSDWRVGTQDANSVRLDGTAKAAILHLQSGDIRIGSLQIASATNSTPTTIDAMTSNWMRLIPGTSVRSCIDETPQEIGGIGSQALGACYMMDIGNGVSYPMMETFWRATNPSGTTAYMVWVWASAFNFIEFEAMAAEVIKTIEWKLS